jgi:hypothetical protein
MAVIRVGDLNKLITAGKDPLFESRGGAKKEKRKGGA